VSGSTPFLGLPAHLVVPTLLFLSNAYFKAPDRPLDPWPFQTSPYSTFDLRCRQYIRPLLLILETYRMVFQGWFSAYENLIAFTKKNQRKVSEFSPTERKVPGKCLLTSHVALCG